MDQRSRERVPTRETPVFKKGNAPTLGKLSGLIPEADQEGFLAFAAKKPRIAEILKREELNDGDKSEISAAYSAYKNEQRTSTALVRQEILGLATTLGMKDDEVRGYLEVYRPEQLGKLALVAQREGLDAKNVVAVDLALLLDGSYATREDETVTVASVHGELVRIIRDETERHARQKAIQAEDEGLDAQWERLLEKYEGDEEQAAVEYAAAAKEKLDAAAGKAEKPKQFELRTEAVVELFKLFNYDSEQIRDFVEYVEYNFSLEATGSDRRITATLFGEILGKYVEEHADILALNERSEYYQMARTKQLEKLVKTKVMPATALLEVGVIPRADAETSEEGENEE